MAPESFFWPRFEHTVGVTCAWSPLYALVLPTQLLETMGFSRQQKTEANWHWLCRTGRKQVYGSGPTHTYNLAVWPSHQLSLNPTLLLKKHLLFFLVSVRGQQISWHPLLSKGSFQFGDPEVGIYCITISLTV